MLIAATLKHVAKTVAHVDLSDHIIQVVYTIFDENSELSSLIRTLPNAARLYSINVQV